MASTLISLLITLIVLAIIAGVIFAVLKLITPALPAPFGQVITIVAWAILAIVVLLYVLVPLIRMIPAAAGAG